MSAMIVGLTGGIGSGKSAAADLFAAQGIELVDTDLLAREVVEPGSTALAEIAEHFGKEILDASGALDRARLRAIIFADPNQKAWLERLLHPAINTLMLSRLSACTGPYCLLVSPLLLETEQANAVDRILVIDACREIQLMRTLQRDGSSRETVEAIIDSQIPRSERLKRADDIISNESDLEALAKAVLAQHHVYCAMAEDARGKQTLR